MPDENFFDFGRGDILATSNDCVVGAPLDEQVAVSVEGGPVSCGKPAIAIQDRSLADIASRDLPPLPVASSRTRLRRGAVSVEVNDVERLALRFGRAKPFTYLLALERGETPASMVADVRTSFPTDNGFYRPENYNRRCYGPVRYRTAGRRHGQRRRQ